MAPFSRRDFLQTAAFSAAGAGLLTTGLNAGTGAAQADPARQGSGYLVGAGKGDMTGAIAGQGMMGYSDAEQVARGLRQRTWARAYVIADAATGRRVLFITADIACIFTSHHSLLLAELAKRYGSTYTVHNVNINATHNHNSCGGTSWDYAYVLAAMGHRRNSLQAELAGLLDAVAQAHDSLGPGTVEIGRTELHDASANRSRQAFDRNPKADRRHFPERIDPQVTALRLHRDGRTIGEITWFATHGTSLTDANFQIGPDNKGFASYLGEQRDPGIVSAHAQTNAGDMSPNLWLRKMAPGGPTADHRTNNAIVGQRQDQAGRRALAAAAPMSRSGVDSATRYVNLSAVQVSGDYTPHGKRVRTSPAIMGVASAATSQEDNTRSQLAILQEGFRNEFAIALGAGTTPAVEPWITDSQSPKTPLFPLGLMPPRTWVEQTLPLQLLRIGDLVLAALPAEATVVAGLRIRQVVADALDLPLENVLLQGYANGYSQYVTTPEEYVAQQYEGGATLFGRWTLCAYLQEFHTMARAMARGRRADSGPRPGDRSGLQPDLLGAPPADTPMAGRRFGAVVQAPKRRVSPGDTVTVAFCGAHPANRVRRRPDTAGYFVVERSTPTGWITVHDDDAAGTELRWARPAGSSTASKVTIVWQVPRDTQAGRYRIRYFGDAKAATGRLTAFTGNSGAVEVG